MKVILSHTTALEYWRLVSAYRLPTPTISRVLLPGASISKRTKQEVLDRIYPYYSQTPIHVLTDEHQRHAGPSDFVFHTRSKPLPEKSLVKIADDIYSVTPELCLMQLASEIELHELIKIAYELCGTYTFMPDSQCRFNCAPVTSPRKIAMYIKRVDEIKGKKQLASALPHILSGSASPMETILTMLLCLPYRYGGYGLPKPELNYNIYPNVHDQNYTSQRYYSCDLYWAKDKLAVEYDSNAYHTGAHRIAKDSKRRDELTGLKINTVTVTTQQIFNLKEFEPIAYTLARKLKKRIRPPKGFCEQQFLLRHNLLEAGPLLPAF